MFARFSLPDVATVSRRTVFSALTVGVLGLILCLVLNAALVGLGLCIGLGLGIFNFRMVQRSVVKVGARADENKRRPLALNTVGRLGLISVVALGLLFLSFDLGFGVLAGLAAFQLMLLINVARSMAKMGTGGFDGVIDVDALDGGVDDRSLDAVPVPDELPGGED
jgi:hypothetical protein